MDPSYDLYVFHGKSAEAFARDAAKKVSGRRVVFVKLSSDNMSADQYNALLKTQWFYDQIDAENILVFQTDAILCAKSPFSIKEFEQYGYIGCPYDDSIGKGVHWGKDNSFYGIGGLSFRKKSTSLDCLARMPPPTDTFAEDVYFSNCVENGFGKKPESADVMDKFCTQRRHVRPSFGMHKPDQLDKGSIPRFLGNCPEAAPFFSAP